MEVAKPAKPSRAWIAPTVVVAVAGAGAVFGLTREDPSPPALPSSPRCATASDRLIGVWDPDTRERISAKFAAVHQTEVDATWRALTGDLDRYALRWSELWTTTCKTPDGYAQQLKCLENAVMALGDLTRSLGDADVLAYKNKGTSLPDLERCASVQAQQ